MNPNIPSLLTACDEKLYCLTYISRATREIGVDELKTLVAKAEYFNSLLDITGALVYSHPFFLQDLEGRPESIKFLYEKIAGDIRHTDLMVIRYEITPFRRFSQWGMSGVHADNSSDQRIVRALFTSICHYFTAFSRFIMRTPLEMIKRGVDLALAKPIARSAFIIFVGLVDIHHPSIGELFTTFSSFARLVADMTEKFEGEVCKIIGKTLLITFAVDRSAKALQFAIDVTNHITSTIGDCYAGLEFGTIVEACLGSQRADYSVLGEAVNVASRMMTLAESLKTHRVVMTGKARAFWKDAMEDLGLHNVKGVAEKIHAYAVTGAKSASPKLKTPQSEVLEYDTIPNQSRPMIFPKDVRFNDNSVDEMVMIGYISLATRPISPVEIETLVKSAAERNSSLNVSGFLVNEGGFFFQVLEGEKSTVYALYEKISKDVRHTNTRIIFRVPIKSRQFGEWMFQPFANSDGSSYIVNNLMSRSIAAFMSMERFVSFPILESIKRQLVDVYQPRSVGIGASLSMPPTSVHAVVSVFDICGFTRLTRLLGKENACTLASTFVDIISTRTTEAGGVVWKFLGDGAITYFSTREVSNAVSCAMDIQSQAADIREKADSADPRAYLNCGIGIAAGQLVFGVVGTEARQDVLLMGSALDSASVLEQETRKVGRSILISVDTFALLEGKVKAFMMPVGPLESINAPAYGVGGNGFILDVPGINKQYDSLEKQTETRPLSDYGSRTNIPQTVIAAIPLYEETCRKMGIDINSRIAEYLVKGNEMLNCDRSLLWGVGLKPLEVLFAALPPLGLRRWSLRSNFLDDKALESVVKISLLIPGLKCLDVTQNPQISSRSLLAYLTEKHPTLETVETDIENQNSKPISPQSSSPTSTAVAPLPRNKSNVGLPSLITTTKK